MAITSNNPVTVTTQTQTYNTWWVVGFSVLSDDPSHGTKTAVQFRLAQIDGGGNIIFYKDPVTGAYMDKSIVIDDIFATDPQELAISVAVGQAFQAIFGIAPPANITKNMALQFVVGCLGGIGNIKGVIS